MFVEILEQLVYEIPDGSDPQDLARVYRETYARKKGAVVVTADGRPWRLIAVSAVTVTEMRVLNVDEHEG